MAFQVSPGINVSEIDLTTIIPAVSTSVGAVAGVFGWGPVGVRVLVDSELTLAANFGTPTNFNAETWFSAASFLGYGNSLWVSRAANTTSNTLNSAYNAIGNTASVTNVQVEVVKNDVDYDNHSAFDSGVLYIAKYPGAIGNSLRVAVCDSNTAFESSLNLSGNSAQFTAATSSNTGTFVVTGANASAQTAATDLSAALQVGDLVTVGNSTIGKQLLKISVINAQTSNATATAFVIRFVDNYKLATTYVSNTTLMRNWEFFNLVDRTPGTSAWVTEVGNTSAHDELHVVVVDEKGKFSGNAGTILEVYKAVSRATDGKTVDGASNYYKDVINQTSKYIWWANHSANSAAANAALVASSTNVAPFDLLFNSGNDGPGESNVTISSMSAAYDLFVSPEEVDVSLIIAGKARGGTNGEQLANYIIDNITEVRKDCVVFVSPEKADVVNNVGSEADDIVTFRNSLRSTSYAMIDSGYKYQYDRYNDIYRYIPLNGDIAGLCARTDTTNDAWWSPAGFNRGQIKNLVKLAYNPRKAYRDLLYKNGINPVVAFPGQGTILYGDKTALAKPSAFDRINVRRLFIVLERAISVASKYTLFEFNDEFTRAQFKSIVNPYLRNVQGRRGITDFIVVCDTTNNTPEVIDRNEFIGDIYIKPARSINYIQLNFVAVRTGVQFSEVIGKFG